MCGLREAWQGELDSYYCKSTRICEQNTLVATPTGSTSGTVFLQEVCGSVSSRDLPALVGDCHALSPASQQLPATLNAKPQNHTLYPGLKIQALEEGRPPLWPKVPHCGDGNA